MDREKALSKCMNICSMREYCIYDIEQKIDRWEVKEVDREYIIRRLLEDNFINHNRYVKAFINDKLLYNHWGKIKIRYHLKHKNIEVNIIETYIDKIDEITYKNIIDTEIIKKKKSVKGKDEFEINQKVARFLISKGFEPNIVFDRLKK